MTVSPIAGPTYVESEIASLSVSLHCHNNHAYMMDNRHLNNNPILESSQPRGQCFHPPPSSLPYSSGSTSCRSCGGLTRCGALTSCSICPRRSRHSGESRNRLRRHGSQRPDDRTPERGGCDPTRPRSNRCKSRLDLHYPGPFQACH